MEAAVDMRFNTLRFVAHIVNLFAARYFESIWIRLIGSLVSFCKKLIVCN